MTSRFTRVLLPNTFLNPTGGSMTDTSIKTFAAGLIVLGGFLIAIAIQLG